MSWLEFGMVICEYYRFIILNLIRVKRWTYMVTKDVLGDIITSLDYIVMLISLCVFFQCCVVVFLSTSPLCDDLSVIVFYMQPVFQIWPGSNIYSKFAVYSDVSGSQRLVSKTKPLKWHKNAMMAFDILFKPIIRSKRLRIAAMKPSYYKCQVLMAIVPGSPNYPNLMIKWGPPIYYTRCSSKVVDPQI